MLFIQKNNDSKIAKCFDDAVGQQVTQLKIKCQSSIEKPNPEKIGYPMTLNRGFVLLENLKTT